MKPIDLLAALVGKTARMREAQRQFIDTHSATWLEAAEEAEREVDELLSRIEASGRSEEHEDDTIR